MSTDAKKPPPKVPPHRQPLAPPPAVGGQSLDFRDGSLESAPNTKIYDTNPWGPGATPPPGTAPPGPDPSVDWASAFFGALGLPDDVMGKVVSTLRDHAQDPKLAQALATQYIRSTGWYAIHYPGALEGIAKGVIQDESQYTDYVNQANVLSRQYNGRDVSGDEVKGWLQAGYDLSHVSKLYGGQAWVQANQNDVNYTLGAFGDGRPTGGDLTALGNENANLDSVVGQRMQKQLADATQRLHAIFRGSLATPSLSMGPNGLQAPSLNGGKQPTDLGA